MKVEFLGTGTSQGIPVIGCECEVCKSDDVRDQRLRSSIFIEHQGLNILIDTTPDLRQQMLTHKVKRVDCVLFTHEHNDHTAGLDDLRAYNFMQGGEMPIYGQKRVIENIISRFDYAFTGGKYPGAPRMQPNFIDEDSSIQLGNVNIIPIPIMHGKLPIVGYRIDDFAYLTDASFIAESSLDKLKGLKMLVISGLRHEKHHSHLTITESLEYIKKINPEKALITHISHKLGRFETIQTTLPENVELAFDQKVIFV